MIRIPHWRLIIFKFLQTTLQLKIWRRKSFPETYSALQFGHWPLGHSALNQWLVITPQWSNFEFSGPLWSFLLQVLYYCWSSTWRGPCSSSHKLCLQFQLHVEWSRLFDESACKVWWGRLFSPTSKFCDVIVHLQGWLSLKFCDTRIIIRKKPWYIGMGKIIHMKAVVLDFVEAEGTRTHL